LEPISRMIIAIARVPIHQKAGDIIILFGQILILLCSQRRLSVRSWVISFNVRSLKVRTKSFRMSNTLKLTHFLRTLASLLTRLKISA
jgi:hypothetical protein